MKKNFLIAFILLFSVSNYSYAHDNGRIDELEKRVMELEDTVSSIKQLLLLAAMSSSEGKSETNEEDAKKKEEIKAKWRTIATGMTPKEVRAILGEPEKLDGGVYATWYYPKGGVVRFDRDKVHRWNEPRF